VAAHSLGCLIALHLAAKIPESVTRLVLYGPVKPPPEAGQNGLRARGRTVRDSGMIAVADTVIGASLSPTTLKSRPELVGFARELLSRQQPEGYALACEALAESTEPDWQKITAQVIIASGAEDKVGAPSACESIATSLKGAKKVEIVPFEQVGHWYTLEDSKGSVEVVQKIFKL
jgi:3-oxoadipate enol-lactonase